MVNTMFVCLFCFRQKTAYEVLISDWSSDVCSSDLREHLAAKGLGLFNDLQNESSIVGNFPTVLMMEKYGSEAQQAEWIPKMLAGEAEIAFGLTEPNHGSAATWMESRDRKGTRLNSSH